MDLAPQHKDWRMSRFIPAEIPGPARNIHTAMLVCTGVSNSKGDLEMKDQINWLLHPRVDGPRATIILRVMAGTVFFWEGVMKFVFANQGVGRFTKLGFPAPHFTARLEEHT